MNQAITFLHAADLHIDSPFKGFSNVPETVFNTLRDSTFVAYDRLIETAIKKQVDFILIVGDLFNHEQQSLKAQLHVKNGFEKLKKHRISVFLSYGNHDYIEGNIYPIQFPDNVHIFKEEKITHYPLIKNEQTIANIYGFSYVKRDVKDNKARQFSIEDNTVPFHIAMLHGTLHGNTDHDPYAPFRLQDLNREPFDYWALGHIHKRQVVQQKPPIVYPGNIQGRHRKELGEKGCYYVKMDGSGTELEFIPLQHVKIVREQIDVTKCSSIGDVNRLLSDMLEKNSTEKNLYDITLISNEEQTEEFGLKERIVELVELINEQFIERDNWQYIYTYTLLVNYAKKRSVDTFFMEEIKQAMQTFDVYETIKDLYEHPDAKKLLHMPSEKEITERAYEFLLDEMTRK